MFSKILIANRGEIACRIMRTAQRLGIRTVAVYSEADASARHVALADEAVAIGPAEAARSYLNAGNIVQAALRTGAEAIHPGYGFLSENAGFAVDCAAAGITFIGPSPDAIRSMGSKRTARIIMARAGVPVVPGYDGGDQSDDMLAGEARKIGFPVLIKASAGGGGRGMRVVEDAAGFADALSACRREALAAFGDDSMLLEKYLTGARHIEVQVFRDSRGNCVHLFERDCSVQRRHQKIIEESPAPGLTPERRVEMGAAAIAAAAAIQYEGAGTVEFIAMPRGNFYFMEMNTRLQVEHPVTELVTGQDLVEWQLRVAAGESLPCAQAQLAINGHAMEARLYAEDPARNFLPATGHLAHLRLPRDGTHIRVDAGVRQGDTVSIHYDPMIAKIIAWDRDRAGCLRRLSAALDETQIVGVATNLDLLSAVISHGEFQRANFDTGFIDRYRPDLFPGESGADGPVVALASLHLLLARGLHAESAARLSPEPGSPWFRTDGWRLNTGNMERFRFVSGGTVHEVRVRHLPAGYHLETPFGTWAADGRFDDHGDLHARLNGAILRATVVAQGNRLTVMLGGTSRVLEVEDETAGAGRPDAAAGGLVSPMPGRVVLVGVSAGSVVHKGDALVVVEAMKMEHTITAPRDGRVKAVHVREGEIIEEGVPLLELEE